MKGRCFWLFSCLWSFCFICVAIARSELTLEQVVTGANKAREAMDIQSGEVFFTAVGHEEPHKTREEAEKWLANEKAKLTKEGIQYRSEMFAGMMQSAIDERPFQIEKQVAFKLQQPNYSMGGKGSFMRCRLVYEDRQPRDLSKPYTITDYTISVYDGKISAATFENRHQYPTSDDIRPTPESYYFDNLHLWGHGFFSIPAETARLEGQEEIDDVNCYAIKFEVIDLRFAFTNMPILVKYWIAPEYNYRTLKEEYLTQESGHEPTMLKAVKHQDYRQFSGVWFPTRREYLEYFERGRRIGKIKSETVFSVKGAIFNVTFPDDYFTVWEANEEEFE